MAIEQCFGFLLFAVVAAITPGPSNVMLTAAGARGGVVRGLPCLLGVGVGMAMLIFGVALGLGGLVANAAVMRTLNWLGAAFLLWLAWKIARTGPGMGEAEAKPVGFFGAALFQWINPKSWLVAAAAAAAYVEPAPEGTLLRAAALASLFVAAALPSGLVWLAFGASMQRLLRGERGARAFNVALAAALAASVALIVR